MSTAATGSEDDGIKLFRADFLGGLQKSVRSQSRAAAYGNLVNVLPFASEFCGPVGKRLKQGIPSAVRQYGPFDTKDVAKQTIARLRPEPVPFRQLVLVRLIHHYRYASNPHHRASCSELADEVALNAAASDDRIGPARQNVGNEIFQFPTFVTAKAKTREIVPLDPNVHSEIVRNPIKAMERRRQQAEGFSNGNTHGVERCPVYGSRQEQMKNKWVRIGCGLVLFVFFGLVIWVGPVVRDLVKNGFLDRVDREEYTADRVGNLKALRTALMLYHESEGIFPEANGWVEAIKPRIASNGMSEAEALRKFDNPVTSANGQIEYALNPAVAGKFEGDLPSKAVPLVTESTGTATDRWAIYVNGDVVDGTKKSRSSSSELK